MRSYLQFVTTPTADTPGTLLMLHFDDQRYVFGRVGEGSQRAFTERGVRMKKIGSVFITGKCEWDNVGGVIGMLLTQADVIANSKEMVEQSKAKKKESLAKQGLQVQSEAAAAPEDEAFALKIWGPPNLVQSIACARRFVFRKGLPLDVEDVRETPADPEEARKIEPIYKDANIKVWSMVLKPSGGSSSSSHARKRSFADMNTIQQSPDQAPLEKAKHDDEYNYQLSKAVLAEMFRSNWQLDSLEETHITKVNLPARMWVRDPETKDLKEYNGPLPGGSEPVPDIKVLVRKPWPGALITGLPPTRPKAEAVSYIVGTWPRRGKFNRKAALDLGVTPGRDFGVLSDGGSVVTKDGKTVTSDMVISSDRLGGGVAVIDLPSSDYVESLTSRPEWAEEEVMKGVEAVVWILGPGVAADATLRKFMADSPHLKHVVSGPDHCPDELAFDRVAGTAIQLAQIDSDCYLVPHFDNNALPQKTFRSLRPGLNVPLPAEVQIAKRGLTIQMEPKLELQTDNIVSPMDPLQAANSCNPEMLRLAQEVHDSELQNDSSAWSADVPLRDAEVITLGTGSALPSLLRNVSCTVVRVPGWGSYVLDCGENSLGQLQRIYTPDEMVQFLRDLRFIWISHLHADHHLGTISLIKAWYQTVHGEASTAPSVHSKLLNELNQGSADGQTLSRSPYLAVISDIQMMHYLSEYASVEDYGYSHILPLAITSTNPSASPSMPSRLSLRHHDCPVQDVSPRLWQPLLGIEKIEAVDVKHCHGSKGVAVTWPSEDGISRSKGNFKVAYSGDCRPSAAFAQIGQGATVLVHEATFDDELGGEARAKNHSTTSEALRVGALMRARATVLTHFSQRYCKIPGASWSGVDSHEAEEVLRQAEKSMVAEEVKGDLNPGLPSWGQVGKPLSNPNEILLDDASDNGNVAVGEVLMPDLSPAANGSDTRLEPVSLADKSMAGNDNNINAQLGPVSLIDESAAGNHESERPLGDPLMEGQITAAARHAGRADAPLAGQAHATGFRPADMKVVVAFDYMRVRVRDLARMQRFRPALVKLFESEAAEEEGEAGAGTTGSTKNERNLERLEARKAAKAAGKRQKGGGGGGTTSLAGAVDAKAHP